jgi:hypothetical protein
VSGTRTFLLNETLRTLGLFPDFGEKEILGPTLGAGVRVLQYADTLPEHAWMNGCELALDRAP